ncbi:hypothetical protein SLOPH_587, partial [Spraguea lophii 42_110]
GNNTDLNKIKENNNDLNKTNEECDRKEDGMERINIIQQTEKNTTENIELLNNKENISPDKISESINNHKILEESKNNEYSLSDTIVDNKKNNEYYIPDKLIHKILNNDIDFKDITEEHINYFKKNIEDFIVKLILKSDEQSKKSKKRIIRSKDIRKVIENNNLFFLNDLF